MEGTAGDIRDIALSKRPDLQVYILRPTTVQSVRDRMQGFFDTGKLDAPTVLLLCPESSDELQNLPYPAAEINRLLLDLAAAGAVANIAVDESNNFSLSASIRQQRVALLAFPALLQKLTGESWTETRIPVTALTGTPGGRPARVRFWMEFLPGCFSQSQEDADQRYAASVRTVQSNPCRSNVGVHFLDWDSLRNGLEQEVSSGQRTLLVIENDKETAILAQILLERLLSRGRLRRAAAGGFEVSGNVLVCIPNVERVGKVAAALVVAGVPPKALLQDYAQREGNEGSNGLQTFRSAKDTICLATTRYPTLLTHPRQRHGVFQQARYRRRHRLFTFFQSTHKQGSSAGRPAWKIQRPKRVRHHDYLRLPRRASGARAELSFR